MNAIQTVLAVLLIICAVGVILAILGQSAKSKRLGGAISGGAETFLGKEKGKKADIILNKVTTVLVIILAILTIAIYVFQPEKDTVGTTSLPSNTSTTTSTEASTEESTEASETVSEATSEADESVEEVSETSAD
ncbi:MAG: preprotein translocase subunit SecG [Eubacteriales bacterium]|nr:preprotein translocase subunit SecG [Eubacteriales bacterium]MDD4474811.1 preprotein translocase subunit SecG [Eubacteriales bacterium]